MFFNSKECIPLNESIPLQVFIFLFAQPTEPPSQETERWETKHFIGMAQKK